VKLRKLTYQLHAGMIYTTLFPVEKKFAENGTRDYFKKCLTRYENSTLIFKNLSEKFL